GLAYAPRNRCDNARIRQVEPRGVERRLIRAELRLEAAHTRGGVVVLAPRRRVVGEELLGERELGARQFHLSARVGQVGLGARDFVLERPRVDLEEHIALLHLRTRLEIHRLNVARNAPAPLDLIDRPDAAREFVGIDDVLLDCGGNAYRRRAAFRGAFRGATLSGGLAAAGERDQHEQRYRTQYIGAVSENHRFTFQLK